MVNKNIPVFDDDELEIDEVLDSVAWGLCGYTLRFTSASNLPFCRRTSTRSPVSI